MKYIISLLVLLTGCSSASQRKEDYSRGCYDIVLVGAKRSLNDKELILLQKICEHYSEQYMNRK